MRAVGYSARMEGKMTVAEAAAAIGCDASQVRRLFRAEKLAGERVGRRLILLDAASVERYRDVTPEHGGWPRGKPRKPAAGPRGREEATDARD